jgi:hypothetical protein
MESSRSWVEEPPENEQQRLPVDLAEQIERDIALGNGVSGDSLLGAIERPNLQPG